MFGDNTTKPFCQCLHEVENNLPRTKRCMMPCLDQLKILAEREKVKKD
jgi:hypothetical protein